MVWRFEGMGIVNKENHYKPCFMYKSHIEGCPGHLLEYEQAAISKSRSVSFTGRMIIYKKTNVNTRPIYQSAAVVWWLERFVKRSATGSSN